MATALDLKLKSGEEVLVSQGIMRDVRSSGFFYDEERAWTLTDVGHSYWKAERAEVVEVKEDGITKIKYPHDEKGRERHINAKFNGFSRERGFLKRVWDFMTYAYHRCKPV